jgi:hypothetical protein
VFAVPLWFPLTSRQARWLLTLILTLIFVLTLFLMVGPEGRWAGGGGDSREFGAAQCYASLAMSTRRR